MTDILLCYMEAKALLPGVTEKQLKELVATGTIVATFEGRKTSIQSATFSNNSVCAYAVANRLWNF